MQTQATVLCCLWDLGVLMLPPLFFTIDAYYSILECPLLKLTIVSFTVNQALGVREFLTKTNKNDFVLVWNPIQCM